MSGGPQGYVDSALRVYGRCLEGVRKVSVSCLKSVYTGQVRTGHVRKGQVRTGQFRKV